MMADADSMDALERRIRDRIAAEAGWISFETFMTEALYAPGLGYYSAGLPKFGRDARDGSDFITAPEMSSLYGRCLGRQIAQALSASGTNTIVEFGAGSGALAEQLIAAVGTEMGGATFEYWIVELSATLRERQQARLLNSPVTVRWLDELPDQLQAVIVGNEVLDAMPVRLLHLDGDVWHERGVGWRQKFVWDDRPTTLRPPCADAGFPPGFLTEVHPIAEAWVASLGKRLNRGAIFLVDYGFPEREYYLPQRRCGTLMCHQHHRSDIEPLVDVGHKDITSHVNFTGIAVAAQEAGLDLLGYTSQAHFLINCGIAQMLERSSLAERVMAQRLLTEHEMGELFKVIAFAPVGTEFTPVGFSRGDRSHRL